jgi:EAL domain-containing protein (putative c-di-GMP-specific phosphodiesterase class I)/GGDEF domain-containing protein
MNTIMSAKREGFLKIDDFLTALESEIANTSAPASVAVLVMCLQRSDRIAALTEPAYAQDARQQLHALLRPILRDKDRIAFVGENECWIILPQLSSEALSILAVHRVVNALSTPLKIGSNTIFFNPRIGIACAPIHGKSAAEILRAADIAQKNAMAGNIRFLMADTDTKSHSTPDNLPKALEAVLDENSLEMVYQPKVSLPENRVMSVEALVRWPKNHPQSVPTNILIDTAEQCGLIELLTMRVLNKVLRDYNDWTRDGLDVLVWVNLSARLLSLPQLPEILSRILSIWDVPASSVGLEITESAFINDIEHTTEVLFELKNLGFHLSIDDFGTGYSSLVYLRRFPIDEIKIDRMFVHGMAESTQDKQIVKSIIDLAHNFGLQVVAEGVEEASTLTELEQLGCNQIQGYFFARPMPGDELVNWCNEFHKTHQS